MDVVTLALAKNYVNKVLEGIEQIKGTPCVISKIEEVIKDDGISGTEITFSYEGSNGSLIYETIFVKNGKDGADGQQGPIGLTGLTGPKGDTGDTGPQGEKGADGANGQDGADGIGISNIEISLADELIITLTNGEIINCGYVKGPQGEQGEQGIQGEKGEDGYTPIKGTDYWTESEIQEFNNTNKTFIVEEMAKYSQIQPEYASSLEELKENGDTEKIYVLPDGYIYGYIYIENQQPSYTNQISLSIDSNGNIYNDQGYKTNTRLNSSGAEAGAEGYEVTGFIPIKTNDLVRFKDIVTYDTTNGYTYVYLIFYDQNFEKKSVCSMSDFKAQATYYNASFDTNGNLLDFIVPEATHTGVNLSELTQIYVRLSAFEINSSSIITINEEITENNTSGYEWTNLNIKFVETDNTEQVNNLILSVEALEENTNQLNDRISALENNNNNNITNYVLEEADRVIDNILSSQINSNTFTFAAISDMHYGNGGYTDSVKHACQALSHINNCIKLDALAVLGDYTDLSNGGADGAIADFKTVNSLLDDMRTIPNMRLSGNHDWYADNTPKIQRLIQAYNDNVVWGNRENGYFYKDFEEYKLRMICVNTCEGGQDGLYVSSDQYYWFAQSLDLSDKEDAASWQICILSHHPLDWSAMIYDTNEWGNEYFYRILEAYRTGGKVETAVITYDFTGKNGATIIGNIHGHIHNLQVATIADTDGILRISTPESCYGRSNTYLEDAPQWAVTAEEAELYQKIQNTATDTSFCIYCIDLNNRKIYALCYGAGYDRVIEY